MDIGDYYPMPCCNVAVSALDGVIKGDGVCASQTDTPPYRASSYKSRYGYLDTDTIGTRDVFNAADNTIFAMNREVFSSELTAEYLTLESAGAFDMEAFADFCDEYQHPAGSGVGRIVGDQLRSHKAQDDTRRNVTKLVKEPSVTPHQLRHAFATMCYEAGIAPKDAQQLLGHSKVEVTMDTYTHIRKNRRTDIADKLNKAE